MDLPGNNPKCECHQCTWLRANQVERAFMPKEPDRFQKQESTGKCMTGGCWIKFSTGDHSGGIYGCDCHKPQEKKEIEMSPMPCGCRWVNVLGCSNPVHNPKLEPQKCDCGGWFTFHKPECSGLKLKDPVEEKILTIANRFSGQLRDWQLDQLRELVELARKR